MEMDVLIAVTTIVTSVTVIAVLYTMDQDTLSIDEKAIDGDKVSAKSEQGTKLPGPMGDHVSNGKQSNTMGTAIGVAQRELEAVRVPTSIPIRLKVSGPSGYIMYQRGEQIILLLSDIHGSHDNACIEAENSSTIVKVQDWLHKVMSHRELPERHLFLETKISDGKRKVKPGYLKDTVDAFKECFNPSDKRACRRAYHKNQIHWIDIRSGPQLKHLDRGRDMSAMEHQQVIAAMKAAVHAKIGADKTHKIDKQLATLTTTDKDAIMKVYDSMCEQLEAESDEWMHRLKMAALAMDMYAIGRMLKMDSKGGKKQRVICYAGDAHIGVYMSFLQAIGFTQVGPRQPSATPPLRCVEFGKPVLETFGGF